MQLNSVFNGFSKRKSNSNLSQNDKISVLKIE